MQHRANQKERCADTVRRDAKGARREKTTNIEHTGMGLNREWNAADRARIVLLQQSDLQRRFRQRLLRPPVYIMPAFALVERLPSLTNARVMTF